MIDKNTFGLGILVGMTAAAIIFVIIPPILLPSDISSTAQEPCNCSNAEPCIFDWTWTNQSSWYYSPLLPVYTYERHRIVDKCMKGAYAHYKIENGTWYDTTIPDSDTTMRFDDIELGKEYITLFTSYTDYTSIMYVYDIQKARNYCDVREQVYGEKCG